MTQHRQDHSASGTIRFAVVLAASWMPLAHTSVALAGSDQSQTAERAQLREDAETLLKSNRTVLGKVQAVSSDQIKVDIGEMQPRFLPLKQAQQKGFAEIKEGDDLIVTVNAQNLLVDYHPLDGESSAHTIIRGEITQNLTVGHDTVVIKSDGKEQSYVIRSQARSKLAAITIGTPAVFLLDETNQVADATFPSVQAAKEAHRQPVAKPPIKGSHKQVAGTVAAPLDGNRIAVRIPNGSETPFEVRETVQPKISALRKGDQVILLVDTDNKVIDIAVPPPSR